MKTQISCASAQSHQSLCCSHEVTLHPYLSKCVSEDSDQICAVSSESSLFAWSNFASLPIEMRQWRFWSDCANAQTDLNLRWAHMSVFWRRGSFLVLSEHRTYSDSFKNRIMFKVIWKWLSLWLGSGVSHNITSYKHTFWAGEQYSFKSACTPSEDSDQPAHSRSLIRVVAGSLVTHWVPCEDSDQTNLEGNTVPRLIVLQQRILLFRLSTFRIRIRIRIFTGDTSNGIHSPRPVIWEVSPQLSQER